jgi:hypothetical protein
MLNLWHRMYDKVKVVWYGAGAMAALTLIDQLTSLDWSTVFGKWGPTLGFVAVGILAWARKEVVGHSGIALIQQSNGNPPPMV